MMRYYLNLQFRGQRVKMQHTYANSLVTEVGCMNIVPRQVAVHWRRCAEHNVGAQVVLAFLAELAHAAGHSWLYSHAISCIKLMAVRSRQRHYLQFLKEIEANYSRN
jgi:hypothetical protein